jgi:hypothetical protein
MQLKDGYQLLPEVHIRALVSVASKSASATNKGTSPAASVTTEDAWNYLLAAVANGPSGDAALKTENALSAPVSAAIELLAMFFFSDI